MQRIVVHLALLLALSVALTFPSLGTAKPLMKSLHVPLEGTVFVPLSDGSLDMVSLSGVLHVVLRVVYPSDPVFPGDPIRVAVNLEQMVGVGADTGLEYVATGATQVALSSYPPDPIIPLTLVGSLIAAFPPNPIYPTDPLLPLTIQMSIGFSLQTGEVDVVIGEISILTCEDTCF